MTAAVLSSGQISTTSLTTIMTVGSGAVYTVTTFVLTNTGTTKIDVSVYAKYTTVDQLITTVTLPPGAGKSIVVSHALGNYSALDQIKLQGSGGTFNYALTGLIESV